MYSNRKNNYVFDGLNLPPLLSEEDTINYLHLAKDGDLNARNILIAHNIRMVKYIVYTSYRYMYTPCVDHDDLVSMGLTYLPKAIDHFDFSRNVKFQTFLRKFIPCEIKNELSKNKMISISLDATLNNENDDDGLTLFLIFDTDEDIEANYIEQSMSEDIKQALFTLEELERNVVILFYGFYDQQSLKKREIAKQLKIPERRVTEILKKSRIRLGYVLEKRTFYKVPTNDKQKQLVG